jgi:RimJ/RimL family protein N-acetyltransferase
MSHAPPIAAPLGNVTTARLDLRRFVAADVDELATVFAEREVWEFPFKRPFSHDETAQFVQRQIQAWDRYQFGLWIVRTAADGRVIGYAGLSVPTFAPEILPAVEVGWRLSPTAWGRGYATEAATAALDQAFSTLALASVCSLPQTDNDASWRVAERLGMTYVRDIELPPTDQRDGVTARFYEVSAPHWRLRGFEPRPSDLPGPLPS